MYEYANIREISLENIIEKQSKIHKVVAGQSHTLLLTEGGRCYSFGFGREGQLGLGSGQANSPLVAQSILELEAIVDIAAGAAHSLAVNSDGTVWGWGQSSEYQLDQSSPLNSQLNNHVGQSINNSSSNSLRRNSLLSSLMRRGDEQLMSRLMSLQKNVEWIPVRMSNVNLTCTSSFIASPLLIPEPIQVIKEPKIHLSLKDSFKNQLDTIKHFMMECLIRYKDLLDHKSLLNRFVFLFFFSFKFFLLYYWFFIVSQI